MKIELFGESPRLWSKNDANKYARGKWSLGSHGGGGFLTVDGTVERSSQPLDRFFHESLEALELALIAAKLRGDAP